MECSSVVEHCLACRSPWSPLPALQEKKKSQVLMTVILATWKAEI
jgi:hypothetical protein